MIKPIDMPFDSDETPNPSDSRYPFPEPFDEVADAEFSEEAPFDSESPIPTSNLNLICQEFFAPDGILAQASSDSGRNYEYRPQQQQMAEAIAKALGECKNLCIEAPTGVGKSFAYLVPLIHVAVRTQKPVVVSTETITLQEQLIHKDLPLLQELLGIEFRAALAKGRRNYLCRRRLASLSGMLRDRLMQLGAEQDIPKIEKWANTTNDGTRESLDARIDQEAWNAVCCDGYNCLANKCEHFRDCFYYQARRSWEKANIIVANHSLFFTDLAMRIATKDGGTSIGTLLPNYGVVLIDEAHTLEECAADHLGIHLSLGEVIATLNRLYNSEYARGLLMHNGIDPALRGMVNATKEKALEFFQAIEQILDANKSTAIEITSPEHIPDLMSKSLRELSNALQALTTDNENKDLTFKTELEGQLLRCKEFLADMEKFTGKLVKDAVYYAESEHNSVSIHVSPLNIAELLSELLFCQEFPVILCSATLTVNQSFNHFISRTGYCSGSSLMLDSPFDREQSCLYVDGSMPDPNEEGYNAMLLEAIPRFIELTQGKALVLFTSRRSMNFCADALREYFKDKGWKLLIQGEGQSRSGLLREFKEDINSVLFGMDSFWTGVDVPGEALSNVIITKLPFSVPTHPLIAARLRRIEQQGKVSFSEYSLPQAVIKFRQGVGRLIRSRSDRGIIVLLDRRVITKKYGKIFLNSLACDIEYIK